MLAWLKARKEQFMDLIGWPRTGPLPSWEHRGGELTILGQSSLDDPYIGELTGEKFFEYVQIAKRYTESAGFQLLSVRLSARVALQLTKVGVITSGHLQNSVVSDGNIELQLDIPDLGSVSVALVKMMTGNDPFEFLVETKNSKDIMVLVQDSWGGWFLMSTDS